MAAGATSLDDAFGRLADGDRSAFTEVFEILWPRLLAFCRKMLGEGPDAEDAAQNALTALFARAASFDRERSALGWALAIATWECRTIRRRGTRSRLVHGPIPDDLAAASSPEAEAAHHELLEALELALGALSDADRLIVRETLFEMVESEAPVDAAARKRKQRAFERLRSVWRRLHGDTSA